MKSFAYVRINQQILSTSIYDLVLIYVCHFHHQHHQKTFLSNQGLSRYSCLHLGSLHPRIFRLKRFLICISLQVHLKIEHHIALNNNLSFLIKFQSNALNIELVYTKVIDTCLNISYTTCYIISLKITKKIQI